MAFPAYKEPPEKIAVLSSIVSDIAVASFRREQEVFADACDAAQSFQSPSGLNSGLSYRYHRPDPQSSLGPCRCPTSLQRSTHKLYFMRRSPCNAYSAVRHCHEFGAFAPLRFPHPLPPLFGCDKGPIYEALSQVPLSPFFQVSGKCL